MSITIDLLVRYYYYYDINKGTGNKTKFFLCFKHAVKKALETNETIEMEIIHNDDFWFCSECEKEFT